MKKMWMCFAVLVLFGFDLHAANWEPEFSNYMLSWAEENKSQENPLGGIAREIHQYRDDIDSNRINVTALVEKLLIQLSQKSELNERDILSYLDQMSQIIATGMKDSMRDIHQEKYMEFIDSSLTLFLGFRENLVQQIISDPAKEKWIVLRDQVSNDVYDQLVVKFSMWGTSKELPAQQRAIFSGPSFPILLFNEFIKVLDRTHNLVKQELNRLTQKESSMETLEVKLSIHFTHLFMRQYVRSFARYSDESQSDLELPLILDTAGMGPFKDLENREQAIADFKNGSYTPDDVILLSPYVMGKIIESSSED